MKKIGMLSALVMLGMSTMITTSVILHNLPLLIQATSVVMNIVMTGMVIVSFKKIHQKENPNRVYELEMQVIQLKKDRIELEQELSDLLNAQRML